MCAAKKLRLLEDGLLYGPASRPKQKTQTKQTPCFERTRPRLRDLKDPMLEIDNSLEPAGLDGKDPEPEMLIPRVTERFKKSRGEVLTLGPSGPGGGRYSLCVRGPTGHALKDNAREGSSMASAREGGPAHALTTRESPTGRSTFPSGSAISPGPTLVLTVG